MLQQGEKKRGKEFDCVASQHLARHEISALLVPDVGVALVLCPIEHLVAF